ncbi:MAG: hypothetical protein LBK58_11350 [Prevotellaceae bacterium]|nr:hypothetical protein [Prevotellaceae bacterium]
MANGGIDYKISSHSTPNGVVKMFGQISIDINALWATGHGNFISAINFVTLNIYTLFIFHP